MREILLGCCSLWGWASRTHLFRTRSVRFRPCRMLHSAGGLGRRGGPGDRRRELTHGMGGNRRAFRASRKGRSSGAAIGSRVVTYGWAL